MADPSLPGDAEADADDVDFRRLISPFLKAEMALMGVACGLGAVANIVALFRMLLNGDRLNVSARCAVNRAVADTLTLSAGVIDVVVNVRHGSWPFGRALCKARSALAVSGPLAASALLTAFSSGCFLEACEAGLSSPHDRRRLLRTACGTAWSLSFVFGLPTFLRSEVLEEVIGGRAHCVSLPLSEDTRHGRALRFLYLFLVVVVPLVAGWAFLLKKAAKGRLPFALTAAFTICQLPYWTPFVVHEFAPAPLSAFLATVSLPALNAALNPVLCICFMEDLVRKGGGATGKEEAEGGNRPEMEELPLKPLPRGNLE